MGMTQLVDRFSSPVPDVLAGWVARTLPLAPDGASPDPVATLVHRKHVEQDEQRSRAVLYVHGFVDYFFQTHHAQTWEAAGFDFYALDLRDYGRSIQAGRQPNWILDLHAYDEEISVSLEYLRGTYDEVLIEGHSTGGLIVALYASRYAGAVDGVVLNAPWLDLNEPWAVRTLVAPLVRTFGHLVPRMPISNLGANYGRSLHVSTGGEWEYELGWKPLDGFGVYAGWLAAVLKGHRAVKHGLGIDAPVLMATSGARGDNKKPTALELASTDVVLSPPQMWNLASKLGRDVTTVRIAGGRHDLTLSRKEPRERFAAELSAWLGARFPEG